MALFMKMSTSILFCMLFAFEHGFLLEPNNGQQTGTNQGYLTLSEFFDEKTKLQDRVTDLRDDMDKKLTLMSNQLQQMLSSSQSEAATYCKNETQRAHILEQKYKELSENYTKYGIKKLQDLDQKFNALLHNYTSLDGKRSDLEQKYFAVLENNTKLSEKFKDLEEKYAKQEIELSLLRNETFENNKGINNLNGLKNVQQLHDFSRLEMRVQSLASQTNSLLSNERARNEDFRALYNLTVNSDNRITELNRNWEIKHNRTLNILQASEVSHNKSLSDKVAELDNKIRVSESIQNHTITAKVMELENGLNVSLTQVKHGLNTSITQVRGLIDRNSKRVALTACISSPANRPINYVWKFDDVRTDTWINKLSLFKTSGKFHCEIDGLYLVSAWIMSYISNSEFYIYKNGNVIVRSFIKSTSDGHWYTSTAVVAVELVVNDTVWVSPATSMVANTPQRSCLTIIKIR